MSVFQAPSDVFVFFPSRVVISTHIYSPKCLFVPHRFSHHCQLILTFPLALLTMNRDCAIFRRMFLLCNFRHQELHSGFFFCFAADNWRKLKKKIREIKIRRDSCFCLICFVFSFCCFLFIYLFIYLAVFGSIILLFVCSLFFSLSPSPTLTVLAEFFHAYVSGGLG